MKKRFMYKERFLHPLTAEDEKFYLEKMQQGDKQAKEKLILHNMRLVVCVSKKYYVLNEREDLISIGYFGLVKGLESFKTEKNTKLSTYLSKCIENEILMYLRKIKKNEKCISFEAVMDTYDHDTIKILNTFKDESNENLQQEIHLILDKDRLKNLLKTLNEIELKVINLRYGLEDKISRTQYEVAEILGVSRSYISRIERDAINKMKDMLTLNEKFRENNTNF